MWIFSTRVRETVYVSIWIGIFSVINIYISLYFLLCDVVKYLRLD